ncbi:ubiquitin carboxyl-terminal hydrolase 12-like protein isoform X2 [Tanacetum coccineum]
MPRSLAIHQGVKGAAPPCGVKGQRPLRGHGAEPLAGTPLPGQRAGVEWEPPLVGVWGKRPQRGSRQCPDPNGIPSAPNALSTSDILYYEVLDIPLPELKGSKTLNVTFHDTTKNKKIIPVILPTIGQHRNLLYFKFEEKPFWKTIRSRKYFAANRIMCAGSDTERVKRCYKEGVVEYLAKPIKADQVEQCLKEMIVAHNVCKNQSNLLVQIAILISHVSVPTAALGIVKELLGDIEGLTILHTTAGRGQFKVECLCNLCSMPLLVTQVDDLLYLFVGLLISIL